MTIRTHRSRIPIASLHNVNQKDIVGEILKPGGLWYGIDGSWEQWCKENMPEWLGASPYIYELTLGETRMLAIDTAKKFIDFHRRYRRKTCPEVGWFGIDWPKVAIDFDGMEIAPYRYEYRLNPETLWYYGWDCASGCVWRVDKCSITLPKREFIFAKREQGEPER